MSSGAEETISRFPEQFAWEPIVEHGEALRPYTHYLVCGMGGSQLGAMLIAAYGPAPGLLMHRDYGLPALLAEVEGQVLIILSSYSGTTEETLDAGRESLARGLPVAAISTGGKLIEFARAHALPHIVIPDTGLQPRLATGFSMLAIARLMGEQALEARIREAGTQLDVSATRQEGERMAEVLRGKVPLIYTSTANQAIGYIWKIKLNETAKIPAFCNVVPEMCHNELCGVDVADSTRPLSSAMHVFFLEDANDHPRNQLRMKTVAKIFKERGISTSIILLSGDGFGKALNSSVMADWTSYALAAHYGVPDEATPLIAEFKKRIGQ